EVVIDASIWVSSLLATDVNHTASAIWIRRYTGAGGLLVAPSLFVVEIAAALIRATNRSHYAKTAVGRASSYVRLRLVTLDSNLIQDSADAAIDFQLKAGDAFYAAIARQLKIPLVSWNR